MLMAKETSPALEDDTDVYPTGATHSSPGRQYEEPDPRQSLQHVLSTADSPLASHSAHGPAGSSKQIASQKSTMIWIQEGGKEATDDNASVQNDLPPQTPEVNPSHSMTVAHTRRNANGTIASVYSGNKIKHLKKEDGFPLWRRDIQFAFLRAVFEDPTPVFTRASDHTTGHTFADIYIDAMARSSKTSKILKDKLTTDRAAALNMAMVCLLVNVGRMNTTLNFFPEMRAQLRTYHSIPSLQAHQDPNAYKQLQDAPRLKSILKGASEDSHQPSTLEKIKAAPIPRTNPVNLIFVLSLHAPKISEAHFNPPRDFSDLVMRSTLSSRSRAKAFLWLVWFYLESDFSAEAALANPFGPGQYGEGSGGLPLKVPPFEHLTEEQANAENVDTESERIYGEKKRLERKRILEEDESAGPPAKKGKKTHTSGLDEPSGFIHSDTDRTPSLSPARSVLPRSLNLLPSRLAVHTNGLHDESPASLQRDHDRPLTHKSDSSNLRPLDIKTRIDHRLDSSIPAPPGTSHPIIHTTHQNGVVPRRSRPETSYQKAVNRNRKMRIDHILHQQMITQHALIRKARKREYSSFGYLAIRRIKNLPDGYDTEDDGSWGPGGLVPDPHLDAEDFGEEALRHKKVIDRAVRRLAREEAGGALAELATGYQESNKAGPPHHDGEERPLRKRRGNRGRRRRPRIDRSHDGERLEEGLDDLDLDLLGESRDDERVEEEVDERSVVEDSEKDGNDLTEEEGT